MKSGPAGAAPDPGTDLEGAGRRQSEPVFAYVGSFTTKERKARGDGINIYRMDPESGAWTHIHRVGDLVNPSFLAIDRERRFLYTVHADLTEASAFAIDRATGMLTPLNRQPVGGKNPVHLAIDPSGRFLITANYATGTLAVLSIETDGGLGPRVDAAGLTGEAGPHRSEQAGSHPHHSPFDPTGRFIVVPDKGLDRIFVFRLDSASGKLLAHDPPSMEARAGAGPRHVDFHPTLPRAYVINELDSTVTTYHWDDRRGTLEPLQSLPALPTSFVADSTGSEIAVALTGRFVYVSNRGRDSITRFAVDPTSGLLTPVRWVSTQGRMPRFFTLDPSGQFLFVGNEGSDTIITFRVDLESGELIPTGQVVKNGSPACIVFA